MFVDFFIRRPVFATVCALLTIIGGAIAIPTLPIAQYPQLAAPQVTVTAVYTGASAQVVESAVTIPLEQAINGVDGMRYIQSTSSNEGLSQITVTFNVDRDIDLAAVDVQNRVAQTLGRLPNEVKNTGVSVAKVTSAFVFGVAMYAEHGEYSNVFISNYIDVYLKDAIKRVKGVGDVIIFGERKYAMRLWLDPVRLAARQLTATDVVNALREQNVQVAAGQVGREPAPPGQQIQLSIRAAGHFPDAAAFERMIVKTAPDGTLVLLKDIGRAEIGAEDYSTLLRYNGKESLGFGVLQLPTANALDVEHDARAALDTLAKAFPPGLKVKVAFDPTTAVRESISEVLITLIEAIAIVILVIFIFLQSWRSTIIPAITIPVSLIGTFIFIKAFGFSINTLTLFGLTLATGLVVDDAIVVIENIERHVAEYHQSPREAASKAMGEVAGAVIATSLVLIAVFLPIALFPGTTGRIYKQFALTIAFSIALSCFNALTLTPALSALLVRHDPRAKNFFFRGVNGALHWFTETYKRVLTFALRHRIVMALLFVAGLGATGFIYTRVPTAFVPDEDQGYIIVNVQGPPGASVQATLGVTLQIEKLIMAQPEVEGVFNVTGYSFTGSGSNKAILFAALRPMAERKGAAHSAMALVDRLRGPLFGISGAMVFAFLPPSVSGIGRFGGFQYELEDRAGGDIGALAGATFGMMGAANKDPRLRSVFSGFTANDPQLIVDIDREKAKSLDIPFSQISDTLQVYMGSVYVNDFDFNNRSYRVYAQADREFRAAPRDIRQFYVRTNRGQMVPLDAVVHVRQVEAPQVLTHYNLFRATEINGAAAPGVSSGDALAAMDQVSKQVLPQGYAHEWSGISLEQIESGSQALLIFFLGVLVVYLVLAAQYESFALPFIIMLAVPLAIFGALGLVALRGQANDVFCQIGLVMLVGLASKNAILIVEFAEQLRGRGLSIVDAAVEAARIRLRPILMTSLAFILGVLPLVFASGAGSNARHSLGTAVFGGMVFSTALNLFFIPVLYVLVESFRERGGRKVVHHTQTTT
jgi:HAE1 family hydrophobic/amphiphilic exporter-1